MEGFNSLLEQCESIDGFLANVMDKRSMYGEGQGSKLVRLEARYREQRREINAEKKRDLCKEKYWGKSIQELDLSDCQRCTPSYRLLPENYPIAPASQRSRLDDEVLNDLWVSVTRGSKDYSFMRRNQYEESLFRCEDNRFELDIFIESLSSAAKRAEELLEKLNGDSFSPGMTICISDYFTALNTRCIKRLYGDHSADVVDMLGRNPSVALPVVLRRLKQKLEEWKKCRSDFNKVCAEIYAENHHM